MSFLLALLLASVYPGLANLPYAAAVLALLALWAQGRLDRPSRVTGAVSMRIAQAYVALHGTALYLWQTAAVQDSLPTTARTAASLLGFYQLGSSTGSTEGNLTTAAQATHVAALILLFMSLGYCHSQRPAARTSHLRQLLHRDSFVGLIHKARGLCPGCHLQPANQLPRPALLPQVSSADHLAGSNGASADGGRQADGRDAAEQGEAERVATPPGTPVVASSPRASASGVHVEVEGREPRSPEQPGQAMSALRHLAMALLRTADELNWQLVAEQAIRIWEWACSRPSVVSFFVAAMCVLAPSWPALLLLVMSLCFLLANDDRAEPVYRPISLVLEVGLLLWTVLSQLASSIGSVRAVPEAAQSVGVYEFQASESAWSQLSQSVCPPAHPSAQVANPIPYILPFGSMMVASAAVCGFRRQLASARPAEPPVGDQTPGELQQDITMHAAGTLVVEATKHSVLVATHYLLKVLFPATTFLVGISGNDLLHLVYVAIVLFGVSRNLLLPGRTGARVPRVDLSSALGSTRASTRLVKYYAFLHVIILYVFAMARIQGTGWAGSGGCFFRLGGGSLCGFPHGHCYLAGGLNSADHQAALVSLGLAHISFVADMLPVLCLMAFAAWYHSLDQVLESRRERFAALVDIIMGRS